MPAGRETDPSHTARPSRLDSHIPPGPLARRTRIDPRQPHPGRRTQLDSGKNREDSTRIRRVPCREEADHMERAVAAAVVAVVVAAAWLKTGEEERRRSIAAVLAAEHGTKKSLRAWSQCWREAPRGATPAPRL